jgi:hypothetical protein
MHPQRALIDPLENLFQRRRPGRARAPAEPVPVQIQQGLDRDVELALRRPTSLSVR